MTTVLRVRNVAQALEAGLQHLRVEGVLEDSRNGEVIVSPGPVITEYERPTERVLTDPTRDANPVFHLLESLWMLAGKDDVTPLLPFNANMTNYAEEDGTIHGAYGNRWRNRFGVNQVAGAIDMLTRSPETRQCVIAMWDAHVDFGAVKKDIPCNTHIYLDRRGGALNMTVCCRSNDMLWGAYGANAVHFSVLQELIALAVGVPVGMYRQMSNNFHVYADLPVTHALLARASREEEVAAAPYPAVVSLLAEGEHWTYFQDDCDYLFSEGYAASFRTQFFRTVVMPLISVYVLRRGGFNWSETYSCIAECDWKYAFKEWADRRDNSAAKEQA